MEREQRYAPRASQSSNFNQALLSPTRVNSGRTRSPGTLAPEKLVEIPRFKKRDLNLGIVRKRGRWDWERLAWLTLWVIWLGGALVGLVRVVPHLRLITVVQFFDANVLYILVQLVAFTAQSFTLTRLRCAQYPAASSGSGRNWIFASSAYAICLFVVIFGIWLGWEVGYEFWRRWRARELCSCTELSTHFAGRPAIEPIYLSLSASLHLSLISFPHFSFFAHVRLSALTTQHVFDLIPETCHLLAQTLAPTVMLLPRAALAIALLVAYSRVIGPSSDGKRRDRDSRFFSTTQPGQLSAYSRGILIAFVSWAAFRLALLFAAWIGLWLFSGRPLAGIFGDETCCFPGLRRRHRSSSKSRARRLSGRSSHDPSNCDVPAKTWLAEEDEIMWAWRERTRARVQDAFELCLVRKGPHPSGGFIHQAISWGAARRMDEATDPGERANRRDYRSPGSLGLTRTPTEANLPGDELHEKRLCITGRTESEASNMTELGRSRPESGTLPASVLRPVNPSHSLDPSSSSLAWTELNNGVFSTEEGATNSGNQVKEQQSSSDVPGTPINSTPTQSVSATFSGRSKCNLPSQSSHGSEDQFYTPGVSLVGSTSFLGSLSQEAAAVLDSRANTTIKSALHLPSEFGANKRDSTLSCSSEAVEDVDDDSVGLLTGATPSPHVSISCLRDHGRDRSRSASLGSHGPLASLPGSQNSSHSSRARAMTTAALGRARSSSISLLQKSLAAAATVTEGGTSVVKRVRSGTVTSQSSFASLAGFERNAVGDHEDTGE